MEFAGVDAAKGAHGLAAATMQTAVRALVKKGILRYEETRGSVRYRLEDPFLGVWVGTVVRSSA